jgi:hypothetical protein
MLAYKPKVKTFPALRLYAARISVGTDMCLTSNCWCRLIGEQRFRRPGLHSALGCQARKRSYEYLSSSAQHDIAINQVSAKNEASRFARPEQSSRSRQHSRCTTIGQILVS